MFGRSSAFTARWAPNSRAIGLTVVGSHGAHAIFGTAGLLWIGRTPIDARALSNVSRASPHFAHHKSKRYLAMVLHEIARRRLSYRNGNSHCGRLGRQATTCGSAVILKAKLDSGRSHSRLHFALAGRAPNHVGASATSPTSRAPSRPPPQSDAPPPLRAASPGSARRRGVRPSIRGRTCRFAHRPKRRAWRL